MTVVDSRHFPLLPWEAHLSHVAGPVSGIHPSQINPPANNQDARKHFAKVSKARKLYAFPGYGSL